MYCTPGLTNRVIQEEAVALGFIFQLPEGRRTQSAKLDELTEEQWLSLRNACYARLGVSLDPDEWELAQLKRTPAYIRWIGALRTEQQRKGVDPCPGGRP